MSSRTGNSVRRKRRTRRNRQANDSGCQLAWDEFGHNTISQRTTPFPPPLSTIDSGFEVWVFQPHESIASASEHIRHGIMHCTTTFLLDTPARPLLFSFFCFLFSFFLISSSRSERDMHRGHDTRRFVTGGLQATGRVGVWRLYFFHLDSAASFFADFCYLSVQGLCFSFSFLFMSDVDMCNVGRITSH
jgi:hypothetical protein